MLNTVCEINKMAEQAEDGMVAAFRTNPER